MDFFPQQWTNNGQNGVQYRKRKAVNPLCKRLHEQVVVELVNGLEPPTRRCNYRTFLFKFYIP